MDQVIANWYLSIYDSVYTLSGVYDQLTTYSDAVMSALSDTGPLHAAYLVMTSLGVGMLVVYFIITLGTRLSGKEISTAIFFKTLLEFFVGYTLALNSFNIVRYFFVLGDALAAMLTPDGAEAANLDKFTTIFANSVANLNLLDQVLYAFKALLPYLACAVINFFILYTVVTRVLRICVNAVMSPIAIANFFEGSRRSDSIKFIKRTMAMCLQCSVIMIIVAAMTDLSGYLETNPQFGTALSTRASVKEITDEMLTTTRVDGSCLNTALDAAADKLGKSAHIGVLLKPEYAWAKAQLSMNCELVAPSLEAQYKGYEKLLKVSIFMREGNDYDFEHDAPYVYEEGSFGSKFAVLKDEYKKFDTEDVKKFMETMLGNRNLIVLIMLLAVKAGLIKQSISFCNTIVGV